MYAPYNYVSQFAMFIRWIAHHSTDPCISHRGQHCFAARTRVGHGCISERSEVRELVGMGNNTDDPFQVMNWGKRTLLVDAFSSLDPIDWL